MNLTECQQLDALDPLRTLKNQFTLPPGVIYLDGNSLGAMPKAAAARIANAVQQEWGTELIRAWNRAGWCVAPLRLGNRLARWIGAGQIEVVVTVTTSILRASASMSVMADSISFAIARKFFP